MSDSNNDRTEKSTRRCIACAEEIQRQARKCPHCQTNQATPKFSTVATLAKWIGVTATVVSLMIGVNSLRALYQESLERQDAVFKLGNAARAIYCG